MNDSTNDGPASPSSSATGAENESAPACQITIPDAVFPKRNVFSSWYTRKVTKTVNIDGRLPNALFTLPTHLIRAVVRTAAIDGAARREFHAICRKFLLAEEDGRCSVQTFVNDGTTMALDCGRLFSSGNNSFGQCGVVSEEDEVTGPRHVRLPPVLDVWCFCSGWLACTTSGLYGWGRNHHGRLGVQSISSQLRFPHRVYPGQVVDVRQFVAQTLFTSSSGWVGAGSNTHGQLGQGHNRVVPAPAPIPGTSCVTRWCVVGRVTFAWSDAGLLACGANRFGQCGVGSTERYITTLTSVALPGEVKGRVDRVVGDGRSTFMLSGRRCFGCGDNTTRQLSLDGHAYPTPTELPVPVDDIVTNNDSTVVLSGGQLLSCGDNSFHQLTDIRPDPRGLAPLLTPGPVDAVALPDEDSFSSSTNAFARLVSGGWVGRGEADGRRFPASQSALTNGSLPGWTPVREGFGRQLDGWAVEGRPWVMVFGRDEA